MNNLLENKRIILGVTGSIACYKAADLASKLTQAGAEVDVILTKAAAQFVSPLTFQSVTGRKAFTEDDLWGNQGHVQHIGLGQHADLLVVAPITANTMAALAHGTANNLLTVTALAASCPLLIAPAMDGGMFTHTATQANLKTLEDRGAVVVGPEAGHLASGLRALGRMSEPGTILGHIHQLLGREGGLKGKKVIITAGATQEPLDPVRYLTNRSSGKQGYALAQAAVDQGAEVILISGQTALTPPTGVQYVETRTAEQMLTAVLKHLPGRDALLMAAAVADFRPAEVAEKKIKKGKKAPQLPLTRTADILLEVAKHKDKPQAVIGFAAESEDLIANAEKKLKAKKLEMIVANDISTSDAGFGVDTNRVTLLFPDGRKEELPFSTKADVAAAVIEHLAGILRK
ncbi:MAG: bifunctional phosphopantothenoylcysteine decarboxylase/phosphopantothenate--cysteine ligase CoaBC [Chloroflexota bacterium]